MRRYWLTGLGGLFCSVFLVGLVAIACLSIPYPGVTRENCQRLRIGMSQREVEAILGEPESFSPGMPLGSSTWAEGYWNGEGVQVYLYFWGEFQNKDATRLRGGSLLDRDAKRLERVPNDFLRRLLHQFFYGSN